MVVFHRSHDLLTVRNLLHMMSHITFQQQAHQFNFDLAGWLLENFKLLGRSLTTCSSWGSYDPLPAAGRLRYTWCPRRMATGDHVDITAL